MKRAHPGVSPEAFAHVPPALLLYCAVPLCGLVPLLLQDAAVGTDGTEDLPLHQGGFVDRHRTIVRAVRSRNGHSHHATGIVESGQHHHGPVRRAHLRVDEVAEGDDVAVVLHVVGARQLAGHRDGRHEHHHTLTGPLQERDLMVRLVDGHEAQPDMRVHVLRHRRIVHAGTRDDDGGIRSRRHVLGTAGVEVDAENEKREQGATHVVLRSRCVMP